MNISNIDDIEYSMVVYGVLDPKYEDIAIRSKNEGIRFYVSEWKKYRKHIKDISLAAYMTYRRTFSVYLPIWSDDTLNRIFDELQSLFPSLVTRRPENLKGYLTDLSLKINQNSHLFYLLRNILTKDNMYILSPTENRYPYGTDTTTCIMTQKKLSKEIQLM